MGMMPIFWLLLLVLFFAFLLWLGRREKSGFFTQKEAPLDILKRRYVQGKISKGEFEQMKRDLKS
jgi:uncharacterized membrane protein